MRLAFCLTILSSCNVFLSFIFQWYILTQLGAGTETDALFAGMTLPQLVVAIVSGSLMHILVPLLAGEEEEKFQRDAWGLLTLIALLFSIIAVLLYTTAPYWVPWTVPGFTASALDHTVVFTRIQLIGMVFTAVSGVLWGVYHARMQFLWVESAVLISGFVGFGALVWLLPKYGIVAAAWISVLRIVVQNLLLLPGLGKFFRPDLRSESMREAWRRIRPLLIGTAYYKTDPFVERFLLSMTHAGGLSLYYIGQQLYSAANQVVTKAFAAPAVPVLSGHAKSQNPVTFQRIYRKRLLIVGLIAAGGWTVFVLTGRAALSLMIGYGKITAQEIDTLWFIMVELGGVFIGGTLGQITSACFFARGDTVTTTRLGIYSYSIYVPAKVVCFMMFGIAGLAVTTSAFYAANFLLQVYYLERMLTHECSNSQAGNQCTYMKTS